MPNIEIHGLPYGEARILQERVWPLFKDRPYLGEIVITICVDYVHDAEGQKQPFLRLIATADDRHIAEIKEILQGLHIDIEYLQITEFIPKAG